MYNSLRRHVWPIVTLILISNSLCLGQRISGAATLKIDDGWNERIYAINQLEFFEDSTNRLNFNDISEERFQQFIKIRPDFNKLLKPFLTYIIKIQSICTVFKKLKLIDSINSFIPAIINL